MEKDREKICILPGKSSEDLLNKVMRWTDSFVASEVAASHCQFTM